MDVTSLYIKLPQEAGITIVCEAYEEFYHENPPIPSSYLREMLRLILQENSFQSVVEKITSKPGAIIGDGDRKRGPFLVLGLSP